MNDRCGPVHTDTYCTGFQEGYQRWTMRAYQTPSLFFATIAVLVLLTAIGAPSAFALTAYQSGFQHGASDGKLAGVDWYILQPGKGFQYHTWKFVQGYVIGFCSVNPGTSSDADQATWDCAKGPESASWVSGQ